MMGTIGVGIVGASPERGWAKLSHVPAVKQLEGLRLAAVLSSPSSTETAAAVFGADRAYTDPAAFISDSAVDLVAVAVRVPAHRELVLGALVAGKHVYCEWPLGRDMVEADELARAAQDTDRIACIGLQARRSPSLQKAADLVRTGAIGRVLHARILSETVAFGPSTEKADAYLEERANGATLVTIHAGHALDAAIAVLGPLTDIQALAARQFAEIAVAGGTETISRTVPDLIAMQACLHGGVPLTIEVVGGRMNDARFHFEIVGDAGRLVLTASAPRGFQSGRLSLTVNGEAVAIDEGELAPLPDEAANVGGVYAALRDGIRGGSSDVPDFEHAVRLTRLLADVEASAKSGSRRQAQDWPG